MDIPQTSYTLRAGLAFPGQLGDIGSGSKDIESRAATEALDCGIFVVADTAGTAAGDARGSATCQKPTGAGDIATAKLLGVSCYQAIKAPVAGSALRFAAGDMVPVLKKGRIWVKVVAAAVTADSIPYINHTTGEIRGTADASATAAPAGVKVLTPGDPGGVALVEVNLP